MNEVNGQQELLTELLVELLSVARRAAAAGAAVLAERAEEQLDSSNKSADGDWVTAFDTAAEQAVREVITAARPRDVITGEEFGTTRPDAPTGVRWSIDPLDGTANFIRNIVYYGTSVAVADSDGTWLVGVVDAPALGRIYYASRGGGAWLEERSLRAADAGQTRRRQLHGPVPQRKGAILGTGFSYDDAVRAGQVEDLGRLMDGVVDVRRLGSAALDLCMVADGTLDEYGELGLNEHDWAAGALIAEEAGAWVHRPALRPTLDGGPTPAERLAAYTAAGSPATAARFGLASR